MTEEFCYRHEPDELRDLAAEFWTDQWPHVDRATIRRRILERCPRLGRYTELLRKATSPELQLHEVAEGWVRHAASAPRPIQRLEAIRLLDGKPNPPLTILFGKRLGAGKTTVAAELLAMEVFEWDWLPSSRLSGCVVTKTFTFGKKQEIECPDDDALPRIMTGGEFHRGVAGAGFHLDEFFRELCAPDVLLLDDIDNAGVKDKWAPKATAVFNDLLEIRGTASDKLTLVTSNASIGQLIAMCGDRASDCERCIRKYGRGINFDDERPELYPAAWGEALRLGIVNPDDVPTRLRERVLGSG